MTVREVLKEACKSAGTTQKNAAKAIGMTNKQLDILLARDALKATKFQELLKEIGVRTIFTSKETGQEITEEFKWIGKANEFLELLDAVGVEVSFVSEQTGQKLSAPKIRGAGRHVSRMVNRVIYDTNDSDALSNSFYADGKNEYTDGRAQELYIDRQGRYFLASYNVDPEIRDAIVPVSAAEAADFMEKYGTELHRNPQQK